jgi:hypothetical protein
MADIGNWSIHQIEVHRVGRLTHEELHAEVIDALWIDLLEVLLGVVPALNQAIAGTVGNSLHKLEAAHSTYNTKIAF